MSFCLCLTARLCRNWLLATNSHCPSAGSIEQGLLRHCSIESTIKGHLRVFKKKKKKDLLTDLFERAYSLVWKRSNWRMFSVLKMSRWPWCPSRRDCACRRKLSTRYNSRGCVGCWGENKGQGWISGKWVRGKQLWVWDGWADERGCVRESWVSACIAMVSAEKMRKTQQRQLFYTKGICSVS